MSHDRRSVLAALAAGASGATGGCLSRLGELDDSDSARQVSLQVKAPPGDSDPFAVEVARQVATWLGRAGVDARVDTLAPSELRRQVLVDHEFDLFVSRAPGRFRDPDALTSLLHSRYASTPGWHNPFGYADLDVDDLLAAQRRRHGSARRDVIADLLTTVAEVQPFSVVCFPHEIRASRRDRFAGFSRASLEDPTGILALDRAASGTGEADGGSGPRADELRLATTDGRTTETLNPLSTVRTPPDGLTDLLYDPLGRSVDGGIVPWLAADWTFTDADDDPRATVRIRRNQTWHDGEPVTADDVAFTYAFLADTRLAGTEDPLPVPRFQGRTSLVDEVSVRDERTVTVRFAECDPTVATRALTVPVLPEHVWRERVPSANGGDDGSGRSATGVLETNNVPAVGSGPLSFGRNIPGERLVLERHDGHFLTRDDPPTPLDRFAGGPPFERLVLQVAGSYMAAVELVVSGQADATFTSLSPQTVPRIGRADSLRLHTDRSDAFYLVGYNARRSHLSNPRFRAVLGRLLDQSHLVRSAFDGYATPAASPLAGTQWLPASLRWNGADPATPFLGSDGDLDVVRARDAFREIGYRYDGDALVTQ